MRFVFLIFPALVGCADAFLTPTSRVTLDVQGDAAFVAAVSTAAGEWTGVCGYEFDYGSGGVRIELSAEGLEDNENGVTRLRKPGLALIRPGLGPSRTSRVIVHEIGHILFGPAHTASGVMQEHLFMGPIAPSDCQL